MWQFRLRMISADPFLHPSVHGLVGSRTLMQAISGLELGRRCFPDPVVPDDDGLEVLPYESSSDETCIGEDGEEASVPSASRGTRFPRTHAT